MKLLTVASGVSVEQTNVSSKEKSNILSASKSKDECGNMVNVTEPRTGDGATLQVFLTAPLRDVACKSYGLSRC